MSIDWVKNLPCPRRRRFALPTALLECVVFPPADVINPPNLSSSPGLLTLLTYFLHKTYVGTGGGALILQLIASKHCRLHPEWEWKAITPNLGRQPPPLSLLHPGFVPLYRGWWEADSASCSGIKRRSCRDSSANLATTLGSSTSLPCAWGRGSGPKNVIFLNGPNFLSECSKLLY